MTEVLSLTPPRDEQTEQPAQDLIPVGSLEPCLYNTREKGFWELHLKSVLILLFQKRKIPNSVRSSDLELWGLKFDTQGQAACLQVQVVLRPEGCLPITRTTQPVWPQGRVDEESTASTYGLVQGPLWQTTSFFTMEGLVRHPTAHCPNLTKFTSLNLHISLFIFNSFGMCVCVWGGGTFHLLLQFPPNELHKREETVLYDSVQCTQVWAFLIVSLSVA